MNKIGTVYKDYPEAVQELMEPTMRIAVQSGLTDGIKVDILEKMLSDIALQKFLSGGDMVWSENEFLDSVNIAFAYTQIEHLKELKLIDSIEDENGDEVVWLTDEGKQLITAIKQNSI